MSGLLPVFLRREPTMDETYARYVKPDGKKRKPFDVVIYRDAAATNRVGQWRWDCSKPRKGCKTVTFNCFKWEANWLPDLEEVQ